MDIGLAVQKDAFGLIETERCVFVVGRMPVVDDILECCLGCSDIERVAARGRVRPHAVEGVGDDRSGCPLARRCVRDFGEDAVERCLEVSLAVHWVVRTSDRLDRTLEESRRTTEIRGSVFLGCLPIIFAYVVVGLKYECRVWVLFWLGPGNIWVCIYGTQRSTRLI